MNRRAGCTLITCLLLLILHATGQAQTLGPLFTTTEERAYLDALREQYMRNRVQEGFELEEASPPPLPGMEETESSGETRYHLSGIMTRSDGSRRIWLNGEALRSDALPAGFQLTADASALRISVDGRSHLLRPGQTLDLEDGTLLDEFSVRETPGGTDNPNTDATADGVTDDSP